MRLGLLLASLILPVTLTATELMPWFGNDKEFEWRNSYRFQRYGTVHSAAGRRDFDASDHFFSTSLAVSPDPCFALELETGIVHRSIDDEFQFHTGIFTARYNVCNDIVGDPYALTLGMSFYFPSSASQRDIGTLYHSELDIEAHASIGKETACGRSWSSRYWAVLGVGMGIQEDDPWLRFHFFHEWNWCDCNLLRLFYTARGGLGNEKLRLTQRFDGYGNIAYRVMEVGGRYTRIIPYHGEIALELTQRVFSYHAPSSNFSAELIYLITFGL